MHRPPDLSLQYFGLGEEDLDETFSTGTLVAPPLMTLREILDQVTKTYCGAVGVEYMMVRDQSQRLWLQQTMEQTWNLPRFDQETKSQILNTLTRAEVFEKFLHTKFVGQKRFSLEGSETLIPMLDGLVEEAADCGVEEIVIGMPHRGRLNVLANVMEKAPEFIFSEFEDVADPGDFSGDVKYHLGYSTDHVTRGNKKIHLSLSFNPSHLEVVDPVVEGNVRAKQDRRGDKTRLTVMPVLIHGDASFAGQGLVAETLNLSQLEGYKTGGTIHIIVNNQIGFTTAPRHARSFLYPSDMSKMLMVPVFHVNADDPEAAMHVMKLAVVFRQQFKTDIVIDLFCYRRHGHNEMDEPAFTQPLTYKLIGSHPSTLQIYSQQLQEQGAFTARDIEDYQAEYRGKLDHALEHMRKDKVRSVTPTLGGAWAGLERFDKHEIVITEVNREVLREIGEDLISYPKDFTPHPRILKLLETRGQMTEGKTPIDWGCAELLAYGSLVREGFNVRMSGQDCTRGTFSHRHANLVDHTNGRDYIALQHLRTQRGQFTIHDSPLSEAGVLGFDFGYSLADPLCLTIWEAQFGDFANGAQMIIDQFIASSELKWLRMSGLVMLLPHGYEGQGPEHSSARLERYLQQCAENNVQVCYPTSSAQVFHLLRRQLHRNFRKPLIVMSPKSMLRNPAAASSLDDLIKGSFREVLFEKDELKDAGVKRVIFCTGKVYYDLLAERRQRKLEQVAVIRIEQLYPFPADQVTEVLKRYDHAQEIVWAQEEPKNMGSWTFVAPLLPELLPKKAKLRYAGRSASASPAVGSHHLHDHEQKQLVGEALA
jgi:2-oxoglutarate dehydrogenase E1 component